MAWVRITKDQIERHRIELAALKTFCRKLKGQTKLTFHVRLPHRKSLSLYTFLFHALDFSGHSLSGSLNFLSRAIFSVKMLRRRLSLTGTDHAAFSYMIDPAKKLCFRNF
jgi:hypothetical protein